MSHSSDNSGMREIKIYQRTYYLPVLEDQLGDFQSAIREGSEKLQRGYIEKVVPKTVREETVVEEEYLFFFRKRVPKAVAKTIYTTVRETLNPEKCFEEMDNLVENYDAVIENLQMHQEEYQAFFEDLADEIRDILKRKCEDLANVEKERLEVEQIASLEDDSELLQAMSFQKMRIWETAKAFGYAAILMLKQLDLMSVSLEKITNDQQTQREVLEKIVKSINNRKRAYKVQRNIDRLEKEAQDLTKIALNFQDSMKTFLGSFQTLLNNVANVDKELSGAMQEIERIAELVTNQQNVNIKMNDKSSLKILDFLVNSNIKKDRLLDTLEQVRDLPTEVEFDYNLHNLKDTNSETSLDICLDNIQTYVQFQIKPVLEAKEKRNRELINQLMEQFVDIPAGSFMMGSNNRYDNAKPVHEVNLSAFKMSKYLITQKQYEAVMGSNPSYFTYDKSCPVDCVTWHDAVAFCKKLSKITGQKVKLPSEAQWEYTCRAGSTGKYCFGDDVSELEKYAWFGNNSGDAPLNTDHIWETNQNNYFDCLSENDCGTNKVGEKLSNTWGLYDMHGNVLEWCEDVWHENYNNAPIRGNVWRKGGDQNKRILRGGSCYRRDCDCSSAKRDSEFANGKFSDIGFRVVIL